MLSDAVIEPADFDEIIIATVLPLIALVFGTSALGSELEEGTIVYLLAKLCAGCGSCWPRCWWRPP